MIVRITARQRELEEENLPFFTERGEVLRVAFAPVHIPVLQVPREGRRDLFLRTRWVLTRVVTA